MAWTGPSMILYIILEQAKVLKESPKHCNSLFLMWIPSSFIHTISAPYLYSIRVFKRNPTKGRNAWPQDFWSSSVTTFLWTFLTVDFRWPDGRTNYLPLSANSVKKHTKENWKKGVNRNPILHGDDIARYIYCILLFFILTYHRVSIRFGFNLSLTYLKNNYGEKKSSL